MPPHAVSSPIVRWLLQPSTKVKSNVLNVPKKAPATGDKSPVIFSPPPDCIKTTVAFCVLTTDENCSVGEKAFLQFCFILVSTCPVFLHPKIYEKHEIGVTTIFSPPSLSFSCAARAKGTNDTNVSQRRRPIFGHWCALKKIPGRNSCVILNVAGRAGGRTEFSQIIFRDNAPAAAAKYGKRRPPLLIYLRHSPRTCIFLCHKR